MRSDVFVYISGPMTAKDGRTIEENVAAGVKIYLDLLRLKIPAFCPHLSGMFPSAWTVLDHATWLEYDFRVIDRCTHVLLMDRWETSTGARAEAAYAEKIGVPVFTSVVDLVFALRTAGRL